MPSEIGPEAAPTSIHVTVAPLLDFHFSLYLLGRCHNQPERWVPPWVTELHAANRVLVDAIMEFWRAAPGGIAPGNTNSEWGEFLVGAWQAGVLLDADPGAVLPRIEQAFAAGFETPPLPSEPPEVTALIGRRIAALHADAGLRERYVALLGRLWDAIAPYWERQGRREAESTAAGLQARLRTESDLRRLVPGNTFVHKDPYQPLITAARERGELHIIPLGLGGEGQLFWAFPGFLFVGSGLAVGEKLARRRERAESAAARFKVLSDPTRLAILAELLHADTHNATTVTELASLFGLSQPTVSVHMKMLREAGLFTSRREGNQVSYSAADETLREFIGGALADVLRKGAHATASPGPDGSTDC